MCGKRLSLLFLALLLVSAVCYSLSPEEKEALQGLDREILIQIIIEYDEGVNALEASIMEREKDLDETEKDLNEREAVIEEKEKLLITQGLLYQESYEMHRKTLIKNEIMKAIIMFETLLLVTETVMLARTIQWR
jgi:hypothetical protein